MPNIITVGISESLLADFEALKDTPAYSGNEVQGDKFIKNKYHEKTIERLAQYICCRNYAKLTLELSYLAWAIINFKREHAAMLSFFWIDETIAPQKFRKAFEQSEQATWLPHGATLSIDEIGLCINFKQSKFVISATRVSLLSAFLELLATHIKGVLDDFEISLLGGDEKTIKKHANHLQKKIYEWLKDQLPSAKVQQRFRHIDHWYKGLNTDRHFSDQDVLNFWKDSRNVEGYVRFASALEDVLDYELAKRALLQSFEAQNSLALEDYAQIVTQDEISLYESSAPIFEALETSSLSNTPKFLSAKQAELAMPHVAVIKANLNIGLSAWRNSVFGQWQSQLIQLSRSGIDKTSQKYSQPQESYTSHYGALVNLKKAIKLSLLSCVAVLYNKQSLSCLTVLDLVLEELIDGSQLEALRKFLASNISTQELQQTKLLFQKIKQWQLQKPVLNKVFDLAQQTLKKNNKQGFKDWQNYDEDCYITGIQQLLSLDKMISQAIACIALDNQSKENVQAIEGYEQNFIADLCIFIEEFKLRHQDVL